MTANVSSNPLTGGPGLSDEVRRRVNADLSGRARIGLTMLLLVNTAMAGVVASLWLTEPHLVPRARLGFGIMMAIAVSWIVFALWALTKRKVLLGHHRVIAGRMAVSFSAVFLLGTLAWMAIEGMSPAAFGAAGVGLLMIGGAVAMLGAARRDMRRLMTRRIELEREIAGRTGSRTAQ